MDGLFIAGIPRSGTTLLADILGAGLNSVVTPESQFLDSILPREIVKGQLTSVEQDHIKKTLFKSNTFRRWNIEVSGYSFYSYSSLVEQMIIDYSRYGISDAGALSKLLWIDHTPSNALRYSRMKQLVSSANFIIIHRDPRAIYSSVKDLDWGPSDVQQFVQWWLARVAPLTFIEKNNDVMTVSYESLVGNAKNTLKLLSSNIEICNPLEVTDALRGGGFRVPKYTMGQHAQVGGGLKLESLSRWKLKLSEHEVAYIEYFLKDYMGRFNYPLICKNSHIQEIGGYFRGKNPYKKMLAAIRYWRRNRS